MIDFLASAFGYVLNFIYEIVKNYGWAIILFSILIKLIMLPLSIKQQKSMKKSMKMQEKTRELQEKYKNDREKLNNEIMELYKRENISPFAGCLTSILQIVLLFSIFFLVRSPLTHMVKMEPATIEKYITEVKKEAEENGEKTAAYPEIALIKMAREKLANSDENEEVVNSSVENEVEEAENKAEESRSNNENEVEKAETTDENKAEDSNKEENEETTKTDDTIEMDEERKADYEKMAINMDFLGVDLSNVPSQDMSNPTVFIIPALYVISSFISIWISTNSQKKMQKESSKAAADDPMSGATKSMMWFMPIMSISIAIIAPLGLALYWLVNNILMTIERLIMDAFIKVDDEEEKKPIEVKKLKKRRTKKL